MNDTVNITDTRGRTKTINVIRKHKVGQKPVEGIKTTYRVSTPKSVQEERKNIQHGHSDIDAIEAAMKAELENFNQTRGSRKRSKRNRNDYDEDYTHRRKWR